MMTSARKQELICELDIDELVDHLTPADVEKFLDEFDDDDSTIPPSLRCSYKCEKAPTGPLDHKKLLDFIHDQALNTPDIPEAVPFVAGTVRGKKWVRPSPVEPANPSWDDSIELDIDMGVDTKSALENAPVSEIVDLAGILGLHSIINQDQYHSAQSAKWSDVVDPTIGWNGVTKATPLKEYPAEEPNRTDPEQVISKLRDNDESMNKVNLNNVYISDDQLQDLFDVLRYNKTLKDLSLSNTALSDLAAVNLARAIEDNKVLQKLNIESNNITPQTIVKIFEAAKVQQVLQEIKASNQKAQFLGYKVEMAITEAIESNKTILKVGIHFEFGDCRNRVAVHLQKNLDHVRQSRVKRRQTGASAGAQQS